MEASKQFTLIEGVYTPEEAREVLMDVIHSNIQYQSIQNLSSYEKQGTDDQSAQEYLHNLKQVRNEVLNLLNTAGHSGDKKIVIDSTIKIRLE